MKIDIKEISSTKVYIINDNEVNIYNVGELKTFIYAEVEKSPRSMIIDLKNVNYIDSSGIGVFIVIQKKMKQNKGKIAFANINSDIMEIFKMSLLDQVFYTIGYNDLSEIPSLIKKIP